MDLTILIVNTILCTLGFLPSFGLQLAAVMGGAAPGAGKIGVFIVYIGLPLPAMPVISVIGSWLVYLLGWGPVALLFVALPWAYLLMLLITIGIFFILPHQH